MDEAMLKSGQYPNVAIMAGSDPAEVKREYCQGADSEDVETNETLHGYETIGGNAKAAEMKERFHGLVDWCMEHGDSLGEAMLHADSVCRAEQADSREKLEADIHSVVFEWGDTHYDFPYVFCVEVFNSITEWLDRQAAIIECECMEQIAELTAELETYRKYAEQGEREELPPVESGDTREHSKAECQQSNVSQNLSDTREQLEMDMRDFMYTHMDITYGPAMKASIADCSIDYLDRQAAITHELDNVWARAQQRRIAELQEQVDSLTAERDELNAKLKEAEEDIRDLDLEGHVLGDKLAAAEDMLRVVMQGGEPNYDEWMWNHDGLNDWFRENFTETVPQLTAERDRLQRVAMVQADSFKSMEAELKAANDTCNTLRASVAGLKSTVERFKARESRDTRQSG